jgi:hypothetical protein
VRIRLRRPSPALVIACLALFISLGGVSYGFATGEIDGREIKNGAVTNLDIRNGTITTKDLRNNEVRGADIRNSTIGGRDVAFNTLGGNDIKESTLAKVPDADNVDGVDSSAFVRKEAPAFTALTLSGGAATVSGETAPGFDVDTSGYVHLQGTFLGGTGTAFTLPAGFRPAGTSRFVVRHEAGASVLTIAPTGEATLTGVNGDDVSLDGVTFAPAAP